MAAIAFTRPAIADMDAAHDWYEEKRAGLGKQFVLEVDAAVARIAASPARFPLRLPPFRRMLVRKFPYAIYYSLDGGNILVHAVMHMARNPNLLEQRG